MFSNNFKLVNRYYLSPSGPQGQMCMDSIMYEPARVEYSLYQQCIRIAAVTEIATSCIHDCLVYILWCQCDSMPGVVSS